MVTNFSKKMVLTTVQAANKIGNKNKMYRQQDHGQDLSANGIFLLVGYTAVMS